MSDEPQVELGSAPGGKTTGMELDLVETTSLIGNQKGQSNEAPRNRSYAAAAGGLGKQGESSIVRFKTPVDTSVDEEPERKRKKTSKSKGLNNNKGASSS